MTTPDLESFRNLAQTRRVIPVFRKILADGETALGLYRKLADERAGTFLLESAEHGRSWSRYSFVGVASSAMLSERNGEALWSGKVPQGVPATGDPITALRETLDVLFTPGVNEGITDEELPPLTGGVVGYLGYDIVRRLEKLPNETKDVLELPELAMLVATDLAVLDHKDGTVTLIANAINYDNSDERVDEAWQDAKHRLDAMEAALSGTAPSSASSFDRTAKAEFTRETTGAEYQESVKIAQERIRAGDAFQIVLSQRFATNCQASALDVYRVLRATNPSPYMFLFRIPELTGPGNELGTKVAFDVVGSSPEALVTLRNGEAMLHPIAGTRPRGDTPQIDDLNATELLADKKERAEHLMLVDLGRNDMGRVCLPGTVEVTDFMSIEKYSHVMHIVSTVIGKIDPAVSAFDLVAATFPAGTLSGAPKPMAMTIIEELEKSKRGVYGGCVGYFDFAGNIDTAIAIRSTVIKNSIAYVQAGAGVVADSVPESEDAECQAKAMAVLNAVAVANSLVSNQV
ncbi:MAG: anthranilate synthase component I [Actinobacteria bacterium]|nr:anthranilate synthase component I [Actinomycetota bacterium]